MAIQAGFTCPVTYQLAAITGPWLLFVPPQHPLSLHSYPHRAQKYNHTGYQGPTGQRTTCRGQLFNRYSILARLYKHAVVIHPNWLSHRASHGSKEGEGAQAGHTPHRTCMSHSLHRTSSSWSRAPLSRLHFQSPMTPNASDPFDRLKPGSTGWGITSRSHDWPGVTLELQPTPSQRSLVVEEQE